MNNKSDASISKTLPNLGTTRLRLLFLIPMFIAIVIIVFVLSVMLYQQANRDVQDGIVHIRASVQDFYEESIRYDTHALQAIMHTLMQDEKLSIALKAQDREKLLRYSTPLFEAIKNDFKITHLYFTGTDRINLLRAHAPLRYGDVINRITTLDAERSGTITYGLELGPLGTLTLRLVAPWYDKQTHRLIGYVELGMEIDQVIDKLQNFFGLQVFTLVKKEFLNQEKWEKGMRSLGRTPHWNNFPNEVVSEQSMNLIPPHLIKMLERGDSISDNNILNLTHQNLSYRMTVLPIQDVEGRSIAKMILLANVSEEEKLAHNTVYFGSITALIVGSILLIFFYWIVGKIGRQIEQNEINLRELATHDGLTGLYNHRFFYTILEDEMTRAERHEHKISLLMLDIDHFKKVNDTYGHQTGDTILSSLSKRLKNRVRSIDKVCRYGGEEITIILPETDSKNAKKIAEDLRILIEHKPFRIDNGEYINITVSIGVSNYPEHSKTIQDLVSKADTALYKAKENGRNRVCIFEA